MSADALRITIPWRYLVSDNDRYGVLGGRIILTRRYRAAKHAIAVLAMTQVAQPRPRFARKRVAALIEVYMPDNRRRDMQNLEKLLLDSLQGVGYTDDRQIAQMSWHHRGVDRTNPRVEITLEEAT